MAITQWEFSCGHDAKTGTGTLLRTTKWKEKCWQCKDKDTKAENELHKAELKDQEIIALWESQTSTMSKLLEMSSEDESKADLEKIMENCNSLFLKKVNNMASKPSTLATLPDSNALCDQLSEAIQVYEKIAKLATSAAELKIKRRGGRIIDSRENKEWQTTITTWTNLSKHIETLNVDGIKEILERFKGVEAAILVNLKR